VQARDVMTRQVVTVGPDTSTKYAAEVMAERGFAALPVVDDHDQLVGIVAEADRPTPDAPPSLLVHGLMTARVRTVEATDDVSDIARLFVDDRLRSVPVLEHGRLAGIVSRRDLLRMLMRPDADIRADLLRLVEDYTGDLGAWDVTVTEGLATIRRTRGLPQVSTEVEERALRELASTVGGVAGVRVVTDSVGTERPADAST
jgi:CBS domain-containing protein